VPRDEEGRFEDLLSIEEVERRVASGGLRHPAFRVVKEGEKLSLGDYVEDVSWSPAEVMASALPARPPTAVAGRFRRLSIRSDGNSRLERTDRSTSQSCERSFARSLH